MSTCGGLALRSTELNPTIWRNGSAAGELDSPVGKQVQHQCTAAAHGWMMRAARAIHQPTRIAAIEPRASLQGHNQVYLSVWVSMVRPDDRGHVYHVYAESISLRTGLDDTTEPNAAGLAVAHPAARNARPTEVE